MSKSWPIVLTVSKKIDQPKGLPFFGERLILITMAVLLISIAVLQSS